MAAFGRSTVSPKSTFSALMRQAPKWDCGQPVARPVTTCKPVGGRIFALLCPTLTGFVIFFASVLLGGCDNAPAQVQKPEPPRPVCVQRVQFTSPDSAVSYSGTVQARVLADLGFRIGGKVIDRPGSPPRRRGE
jgi:hypothetical protein